MGQIIIMNCEDETLAILTYVIGILCLFLCLAAALRPAPLYSLSSEHCFDHISDNMAENQENAKAY